MYTFGIDIKNDDIWIHRLKKVIDNSGFMMIKCIQWILPSYNLLYPDTKLYIEFKKYYDQCYIHDIKYTEKLYYEEFHKFIYEDYNIIKILGSGSIGQVYLLENIHTNSKYAFKVLHPNVEQEYYIFSSFIKITLCFINYKRFLPINDFNDFINGIKDQLNLNKESNHCKNMYNIYKGSSISIPRVYYNSNKCIMMEYLDGEDFDTKVLGEYLSYKYLMKLVIFTNNSCLNDICHGDIHNGNWKIKDDKLIIYDFGYCFKMDYEEYNIINVLISKDDKKDINKIFFEYYLDKPYNKHLDKEIILSKIHHILDKYEKTKPPKLYRYIQILMKFCLENDLTISTTCLNGLLLFLQLIEIFDKVKILESEATYESYLIDIINHCKSDNIAPKLVKYCEEKIDENGNKSVMTDNFERFNGLKKFMLN